MPNTRMRKRPRTSSTMSTVSPSTTFNTVAVAATGSACVTARAILKRLVAGQRLADGLAGFRVPGFAGSELRMTVAFSACAARESRCEAVAGDAAGGTGTAAWIRRDRDRGRSAEFVTEGDDHAVGRGASDVRRSGVTGNDRESRNEPAPSR